MAQLDTSAAFPLPPAPSDPFERAAATNRRRDIRQREPVGDDTVARVLAWLREQPLGYPTAAAGPELPVPTTNPMQAGWARNVNAVRPISGEGRTEEEESRERSMDPRWGAAEIALSAAIGSKAALKAALVGGGLLASTTEAEAGPKVPSLKQMRKVLERFGVNDAQRILNPGVYKRPDVIAREAADFTAPEHPAMKELFGVNREELWEIGGRGTRKGNVEPDIWMPDKGSGSYAAEAIMNPRNAQRQIDVLTEARKYPQLAQGMESWYVMDPVFQRMEQLVGREQAIRDYRALNATITPFSSNSDVMKELNRGTAANMMAKRGEFDVFARHGGTPVEDRPANFPAIMQDVIPHMRHSMHVDPVRRYLETGQHGFNRETYKNPMYSLASGVPETGFQTKWPIPDAHIARSSGISDVRTTNAPGKHMQGPEYRDWGPWYGENVAKPLGIEAVPAQGLQWGTYAPQTGVKTPVGASKLELLSQLIWERAMGKRIDPKRLRDDVLLGKEHALWALGIPGAGSFAAGAYQPQGVQSQ